MSRLIVAKSNRGIPDPVGLDNIAGDQINPATVEKLDELKTLLASLNAKDFSTQATLALIKAQIDLLTFDSGSDALNVNLVGGAITPEISTLNSSIIPLGVGAIFTGTFEEVLNFAHLTIQVFADQVSAIDGLVIQWSSNGTDIDDDDEFTIPASNGKVYTFGPQAKFFRIKYTNGSVAQTVFRLHVVKKPFSQKPSSHRIADSIATDDDAELVKAVITGEDVSNPGQFLNVQISEEGKFLVSVEPPAEGQRVRTFIRTVVGSHPTDLVTFTVPSGKILDILFWHLQTENAITLVELNINGVEKDAIRFSNSTNTNRQDAIFGDAAIRATAGQVVKISTITGDTSKEYITGFNALLRNV